MPRDTDLRMLFLVQLPPPIHGVTMVSERVLREARLIDGLATHHLWMGGARDLHDIGRMQLRKFAHFGWFLLQLWRQRFLAPRYDIAYCALAPHGEALLRDALLIAAAKRISRRVLVHLHTRGLEEVLAVATASRQLACSLISGTELITLSDETRQLARASGHFARVHLLRNCVPDPGPPSPEWSGRLRCGFLGNLDARKGVLRFVDAIAALREADIPVEGIVMGSDSKHLTAIDVRAYAEAKGVSDVVEVRGFVEEDVKSQTLGTFDLFIYLSDHDLAPLSLLEALAHAAVPVVFDTGALREIVGPDFAAHVIAEKTDCAEYIKTIVSLARRYYEHPQLLAEARNAARLRYCTTFSETAFTTRLAQILQETRQVRF